MQFQPRSIRFVALFTGFVLASAALGAAPAQAMEKSKKLKYGAIAAGAVGAYLLSKGKTVPAATVAAGGYYAYKKSEKARDQERYGSRDRYGYNPDRSGGGDVYPDDYSTQYRTSAVRSNASVRQPSRNYDLSPYLR